MIECSVIGSNCVCCNCVCVCRHGMTGIRCKSVRDSALCGSSGLIPSSTCVRLTTEPKAIELCEKSVKMQFYFKSIHSAAGSMEYSTCINHMGEC